MSSHVYDAKVFTPRMGPRPHLVLAIDAGLEWAFKVAHAYRRHQEAQRLQDNRPAITIDEMVEFRRWA